MEVNRREIYSSLSFALTSTWFIWVGNVCITLLTIYTYYWLVCTILLLARIEEKPSTPNNLRYLIPKEAHYRSSIWYLMSNEAEVIVAVGACLYPLIAGGFLLQQISIFCDRGNFEYWESWCLVPFRIHFLARAIVCQRNYLVKRVSNVWF